MTSEDLKLIRQIVASGGRKYTAGNIDRRKYDRLVDLSWLTSSAINIGDVEYNVTENGRAAALEEYAGDSAAPPGRVRAEGEDMTTQPDSPLAGISRDSAIRLRWTMRDIKSKRTKLSPVDPSDMKALIELGLVEMRNEVLQLTSRGDRALD